MTDSSCYFCKSPFPDFYTSHCEKCKCSSYSYLSSYNLYVLFRFNSQLELITPYGFDPNLKFHSMLYYPNRYPENNVFIYYPNKSSLSSQILSPSDAQSLLRRALSLSLFI